MPTWVRRCLLLLGCALYYARLHRLLIWLNRYTPKVLVYHACEAAETDFTRGLCANTTPHAFAEHLEYLRKHYRVTSLTQLVALERRERAVVITFDDGYRSVFTNAFPELRARTLPATVYLVSEVIDNRHMIWVNELNWLLRHAGATFREEAARQLGLRASAAADVVTDAACQRYDDTTITALLERGRAGAGIKEYGRWCREQGLYLTSADIGKMAGEGITFGNHTATHPSLPLLPPSTQRREIALGRDKLAQYPGVVSSFAHPFGHVTDQSRKLPGEFGYQSAMEVSGWNSPWNPQQVARIPVTSSSPGELFAEMELVAPIKALGRRLLGSRRQAARDIRYT